jgi:ATP-dependent helicase/nuclease subunit A
LEKRIQDQDQRDKILDQLHTTFLVEAAAGTGKTHSITQRMLRVLAEGACDSICNMVAITFTRKAAAELRSRFKRELEKSVSKESGLKARNLKRALENVDQCFIGTIHSFCARLLRERPVEAGIDIAFTEMDEDEDTELKNIAWRRFVSKLYLSTDVRLQELEELGVEIGDLQAAFLTFTKYPDVDEWPSEQKTVPNLSDYSHEIDTFTSHFENVRSHLPEEWVTDEFIKRIVLCTKDWNQVDNKNLSEVMKFLNDIQPISEDRKCRKRIWKNISFDLTTELNLWNRFAESVAQPATKTWKEYRYYPFLEIIKDASNFYEELKKRSARLNLQDLLMKSTILLRDNPHVRAYFQEKYTHILVDEFQDTDPIQAQMLMFLTGTDHHEKNWRECKIHPGRLFVVGDPKQSIYRFRRADITTYNEVKRIILESRGQVAYLFVNFRADEPLIHWINSVFEDPFNRLPSDVSPSYVPLVPACTESHIMSAAVECISVPAEGKKYEPMVRNEAKSIVDMITRPTSEKHDNVNRDNRNLSEKFVPADVLVITRVVKRLGIYSDVFQQHNIPCQVTGGSALNKARELSLILKLLKAATFPHNSIHLVEVLLSEVFGFSDYDLYEFALNKGIFNFRAEIPESLDEKIACRFEAAFETLRKYSDWLHHFPCITALEKIINDSGLLAFAGLKIGNEGTGIICKTIELCRHNVSANSSVLDLITYLQSIIDMKNVYDAIPSRPLNQSPVRIMNLHKAKGLEAPFVFLADPFGDCDHEPLLHVNRSGDQILGFLVIADNFNKELALPENWDEYANRERQFIDAENLRLLYVAATRAGKKLLISKRTLGEKAKGPKNPPSPEDLNKKNPWRFFLPYMGDQQIESKPETMISNKTIDLDINHITDFVVQNNQRWKSCLTKSYEISAAKNISSQQNANAVSFVSDNDSGTKWGSAIHSVLESAMKHEDLDLKTAAEFAIQEYAVSNRTPDELVEIITSVIQSEIWKRAKCAQKYFTELPFQYLEETLDSPTLVRGVMDLIFLENKGWTVVDYKSDRLTDSQIPEYLAMYSPQVWLYAEKWRELANQPVAEIGLYFTHIKKYIQITPV